VIRGILGNRSLVRRDVLCDTPGPHTHTTLTIREEWSDGVVRARAAGRGEITAHERAHSATKRAPAVPDAWRDHACDRCYMYPCGCHNGGIEE
jgi:hypothetical protein